MKEVPSDDPLFIDPDEIKQVVEKGNKNQARFLLEQIRSINWDSENSPCYANLSAMELVQLAQVADYPEAKEAKNITCTDAIKFSQMSESHGDIPENWRVDCAIHICSCHNCHQNIITSGLLRSKQFETEDNREAIQQRGRKWLSEWVGKYKKNN
jgi:hypothetical protein